MPTNTTADRGAERKRARKEKIALVYPPDAPVRSRWQRFSLTKTDSGWLLLVLNELYWVWIFAALIYLSYVVSGWWVLALFAPVLQLIRTARVGLRSIRAETIDQ